MDASDEFSQPCEDRDFAEWHQSCPWSAVWVVMLEDRAMAQAVAEGRRRLGAALLPRYERQPHISVAYRGLCQGGTAHPAQEYDRRALEDDVALLQALRPPPFALQIAGAGSFTTVPYLAVGTGSAELQRLHGALVPQPPAPGWRYVPHLTLGHYARRLPVREAVARIADLDPPGFRVTQLALARYATADIAGALTMEGVFDLEAGRYTPASTALWREVAA
ncbi:MAG: 2'-5' RNA ligase family protein [Comamonas sp.]|nr:2'-5' RNA ligase family protein [Comamonas sp.]